MATINYKNNTELIPFVGPMSGERFENEKKVLLKPTLKQSTFLVNNSDISVGGVATRSDQVEMHLYSEIGTYIGSTYNIEDVGLTLDSNGMRNIKLNVHDDIRRFGINRGDFKFVYNFIRNVVGSNVGNERLFVYEISPSRRELIIRLTDPNSANLVRQSLNLNKMISDNADGTSHINFVLNFSSNRIYNVINIRNTNELNVHEYAVKLLEPLPNEVDIHNQLWIGIELLKPYTDNIHLIPSELEKSGNYIKPANFNVEVQDWKSTEIDFKNWNEILGSNSFTSQKLIDEYISGSFSGIDISIDYSRFENFINFSSAKERINNFMYKLRMKEYYDSQISELETYTGSLGNNKTNLITLKNNLISGFDGFEKFLYYEQTSSLFSHTINSAEYQPFPKSNSDYPYQLYSISSSQAIEWFNDIYEKASDYDITNFNSLMRTIPEHIIDSGENDDFVLFINMIGHHFDIIWTYIKHMNDILKRDEHPQIGLSNQLLLNVAKSYGWNLTHNNQKEDLWKYTFGVEEDGEMFVSGSGPNQTKPGRKRMYETWRRIVNNLPYILKTKGTSRSVKAIISCYGIPQSVMSIREFGGPQTDEIKPTINYTKYENLIELKENSYVSTPWAKISGSNYPSSIELLTKTLDSSIFDQRGYGKSTLFQIGSGSDTKLMVTLEPVGDDKDRSNVHLHISGSNGYITSSINDVFLFNGNYHNFTLQRSEDNDNDTADQKYTLYVKSNRYDRIFLDEQASITISGSLGLVSQSYNNSWTNDNDLYVGLGDNYDNSKYFSGSLFSIRYYNANLNNTVMNNHTLALRAYNTNNITSSYDELTFRVDFNNGAVNLDSTSSLNSTHPNKNYTLFDNGRIMSASLYGIDNTNKDSQTIDYSINGVSLGGNTWYSNKTRIEDSTVNGVLSYDKRVEVGAFDRQPKDSNRLMVAFSPQHIINEDILESFGAYMIDDYIGDPRDRKKYNYKDLTKLSEKYWRKYARPNDFIKYINVFQQYDFSVFEQIKQTLVSRTNKILGLVIEPNILERSKTISPSDPTLLQLDKDADTLNLITLNLNVKPPLKKTILIGEDQTNPTYHLTKKNNKMVIESDQISITPTKSNKKFNIYNDSILYTLNTNKSYINMNLLNGEIKCDVSKYNVRVDMLRDSVATTGASSNDTSKYASPTWSAIVTGSNSFSITGDTIILDSYLTSNKNSSTEQYYLNDEEYINGTPFSSSLKDSTVQDRSTLPRGTQNHRFLGCNLSAAGFNVKSSQTPDGEPIVEIKAVDGKTIIVQERDKDGNLKVE